jgi:hypothetical protein
MNMPTAILKNVTQRRLRPNSPATPPKPTMAEVEMKVAP